jgi:hypothetical protein
VYIVFDRNLGVLPSPESTRRRKSHALSLDQDDEDDANDESTECESEPELDDGDEVQMERAVKRWRLERQRDDRG